MKQQKGFTLIEVVIVVVILGILFLTVTSKSVSNVVTKNPTYLVCEEGYWHAQRNGNFTQLMDPEQGDPITCTNLGGINGQR